MECTLYFTDNCNLECTYCYEGERKNKNYLDFNALDDALQFITKNNPVGHKIYLSILGGEPLLNKKLIYNLFDLVQEKYSKYKALFHYHITTNGIFLNQSILKLFVKNQVDISISIDGDRKTNNINRKSKNGQDYYDLVLKNMKTMQDMNIDFAVRMTVNQNTIKSLVGNVNYFYQMGVKKFNISMNSLVSWNEKELRIMDQQLDELDQFYLEKMVVENLEINIYDGVLWSFIEAEDPLYCCGGTNRHITINSLGELYPCGFVANDKKWDIGNIKTGIDKSKFVASIKSSIKKEAKCKGCEIAFVCKGAKCGFQNYSNSGYLNQPTDVLCQIERLLYKHSKYVVTELYRIGSPNIMKIIQLTEEYQIPQSKQFRKIVQDQIKA